MDMGGIERFFFQFSGEEEVAADLLRLVERERRKFVEIHCRKQGENIRQFSTAKTTSLPLRKFDRQPTVRVSHTRRILRRQSCLLPD